MNFTQALDKSLDDVKRPAALPIGHYIWQITKHPEVSSFEGRDGTQFERVTFNVSCVAASDDVNPGALSAYGNVQGAMNRKTFLFSNSPDDQANFDRTMFNLKRFLGHLGIGAGMSVSEGLAASIGQQFLGQITHRPDPNDPEVIYAEIGRTTTV